LQSQNNLSMMEASNYKINAHAPYSTSYGQQFGYNQRQQGENNKFFQQNYDRLYPSAENLRRQSVAAKGFDRLGTRDLYVRSSNVRGAVNDQLGLIGPHQTTSYKAMAAGANDNLYAVEQDGKLANSVPNYTQRYTSGARAKVGEAPPQEKSRAEQVEVQARWSSRKTAENLPGFRVPNYDTSYTDSYNNHKYLDKSEWMRDNTRSGYDTSSRSFENASMSKGETMRPSTTQATNQSLWDSHPTLTFKESTYPDAPPNDYVKTNIMPQYRHARAQEANGNQNLGMRNIGPPGASRARNKFWGQGKDYRYNQVPYAMNSRPMTR